MAIFLNNSFKENVGLGLRSYSVTWCLLGLEAEVTKSKIIQTIGRINPRNHQPHGFSGELSPLFLQLVRATV